MQRYQAALVAVDLFAACGAVLIGYTLAADLAGAHRPSTAHVLALAAALAPLWVAIVAVGRGYEAKSLGSGATEFERAIRAFFHIVAVTVIALCVARVAVSRTLVLVVLPTILVLALLGRCSVRWVVQRRRRGGHATIAVLAVGDAAAVRDFAAQVAHDPSAGLRLVGACVTSTDAPGAEYSDLPVPSFGDIDELVDAVRACGANAVAVVSSGVAPEKLRWISWQLENTDTMLFVSPGLTEVAGRRLHIQQVCGLPLLNVAQPAFGGVRRVVKGLFDRSIALVSVLALSPLLLLIAALVRCSSRGPALFFQTRVGKDGRTFRLIKFRTMVEGAEQRICELVERNDVAGGVLFKVRNDPRVTRVGRTLRRYSLDELPQLLNVLQGSMSLVGPRPPLPDEVARYGASDKRRLLVKPGLTGLWQISGRSDLSWEESVRLDLRYVENWSLTTDLMILWKTAFAVARQAGAY